MNNRVGENFPASHRQSAAMIGMNMRKQDVGYLLGADTYGSQADRQLVQFGSKEFAGSRIDKNLPLAKLYQKRVDRCVDGRFHVRFRQKFLRLFWFREHLENFKSGRPVGKRDDVDRADFHSVEAGLELIELRFGGKLLRLGRVRWHEAQAQETQAREGSAHRTSQTNVKLRRHVVTPLRSYRLGCGAASL